MKKTVLRWLSALLALTLCFALPVSGLAEAQEETAGSPNDVMALVNGTAVTRAQFEGYRDSVVDYFSYYYGSDESILSIANAYAMQAVVEETILEQKAIDLGLQLSEEEKAELAAENAAQWEDLINQYVAYYGGLTEESTEEEIAAARLSILAQLEAMGYTESIMLDSAVYSAQYEKVYAYMVQDAEVTDADIEAAFNALVAEDQANYENDVPYYEFQTQYYGASSYYTPSGYRGVTHILLEVDQELLDTWQSLLAQLEEQQDADVTETEEAEGTEDTEPAEEAEPVTQEQVDAAYAAIIASVQPTIDEINAKLEAGTPFADLVAEYGTDPGMTVEPTRTEGYPVHMDSIIWDPAFVQGAFSVEEVGAVAEPVVGSYGVHIIQYTRDIPAGPVELTDELRASLAEEVLKQKENELYQQTMDQWVAESEIVYSAEAEAMMAVLGQDDE